MKYFNVDKIALYFIKALRVWAGTKLTTPLGLGFAWSPQAKGNYIQPSKAMGWPDLSASGRCQQGLLKFFVIFKFKYAIHNFFSFFSNHA